ncbi:Predicted Rossmann fold nucleotide-binding protein [Chishuiella changwenlii]|uniref:Predicted Rossmann fold nucleotide-binding protein n=1 Tax=Chishuiella changwenlii TaxID=1434701 RepID=A0A1M6ZEV4_9FLAO|nr:hypothetical protein [Chishuiella changwenlii]GGE86200.1 hypothetical protein GCM10010984_00060 [Chishuiella changwenlii]SHL29022.1 Predicted Rossmann fold nucleotide-binding protein [Chishuiella changwenlii]
MKIKPIKDLIHNLSEWKELISQTTDLTNKVIQDVNFIKENINWEEYNLCNTTFLGCKFKQGEAIHLIERGAFVYPKFSDIPYNPYRGKLYTWEELMEGYSPVVDKSKDLEIYKHFVKHKYNPSVSEAMAQRLHDLSIDDGLRRILEYDELGMTKKKVVGFMGGHSTARNSVFYNETALAAKRATEKGYYVVSGGGPGIMEAANLGAYMANYSDEDLMKAIFILSELDFTDENKTEYLATNYITNAKRVLEIYPNGQESLAIPTWFYGHEPSNLFATHIAKYFSNSIREDMLLTISLFGLVYAPGSAGTTQEIFQEAAQNHYGTSGYYSPMVFLSKKRYVEDTSIYSVLHQLAIGKPYKELLFLTDNAEHVIDFIEKNPPIRVKLGD